MKRATIAGGALAAVLIVLVLAAAYWVRERDVHPAAAPSPAASPSTAPPAAAEHQGLLYGRVTTDGGAAYEGRLRWGGDEEAFWGDFFNGVKDGNPWAAHVPPERLPKERETIEFLGLKIVERERQADLSRPFMARYGDIARIEARGRDVRVTLKSGTVFDLDRMGASDFDDGVRVWDGRRGVVDLESWTGGIPPRPGVRIRTIELLPTARLGDNAPDRLHGTVRTRQGDFTGFVQWDRQESVGTDTLDGRTAEGDDLAVRFDTIRSIARRSRDSSLVTLRDGREVVLSGTREAGRDSRGVYVDDRRYGRVLIAWGAFERLDFSPGGTPGDTGPAYGDFPPGSPLTGSVTTRAGRRLAGRLVYDLDESETTETLDASSQGVNYTIPFGLVASIALPGGDDDGGRRGDQLARVTLHGGEELQLERDGDLGAGNAGVLVFAGGRERPEYVPWADVEQVEFDRPPARVPPLAERQSGHGAKAFAPYDSSSPSGIANNLSPKAWACSPL